MAPPPPIDAPPPAHEPRPLLRLDELQHYDWLELPAWVFDLDRLRIVWTNDAAVRFWRAPSRDELFARSFDDLTEGAVARLASAREQHLGGRILREEWTLYPKGVPVRSVCASRGVRLDDGRVATLFASQPLAASFDAAVLRGIEAMQHTSVRVALHALDDGAPLMRNAAAASAFGPVTDGAADGLLAQLFAEPALAERIVWTAGRGQTFAGEAELLTRQGRRWHAIDARPVRDPVTGQVVLQLNARDVSDLKRTQQALEAARDAAEAANRAKSAFLANMSHEIRTPMNGVLGLTELVLQTELQPRQRHFLELVQESGRSLMAIIDDLLDVTKIEAQKLVLEPAPLALRSFLQATLAPLQAQATARGLRLDWHVAAGTPDDWLADALRLRQVLVNLVGNAVKFTHRGGVQVWAGLDDAGRLAFAVQDSGIGMDVEQQGRVFEDFAQGDPSITRRYGGTGLGLGIVRRLVQLMGSDVQLESTPALGSCFSFALPLPRPGGR